MAVAIMVIAQKFDVVAFSVCLKCSGIEFQIILIGAGIYSHVMLNDGDTF